MKRALASGLRVAEFWPGSQGLMLIHFKRKLAACVARAGAPGDSSERAAGRAT